MSFITYAQNFEDVMLWRALRHLGKGFYIDVGANDPVLDSVTRAFYDRGWQGINIEPVPAHCTELTRQRPHDINLQQAAGAAPGVFTLYEIENVRGWGTLDPDMAGQYRQQGHTVIEIPVNVTTLVEICRQHVTGDIHFLKIDVEGAEEQVLRGMDFSRWRPWIVIAESRVPTEQGPVTAEWEQLLTAQGYSEAYFDGVNTFYLADEHREELIPAFAAPPNALDDFVRYSEWQAGRYAEELEGQIDEILRQVDEMRQYALRLEQELTAVYGSRSWRLTAPLRAAGRLLPDVASGIPSIPGRMLRSAVRRMEENQTIKNAARKTLNRMPGLKQRLKGLASGRSGGKDDDIRESPCRKILSEEAREMYDLLGRRDS